MLYSERPDVDSVGRFLARWNLQALCLSPQDVEAALEAISGVMTGRPQRMAGKQEVSA